MPDGFEQWRAALAGEKPPITADDVWCGYFKIKDRSEDAILLPGKKRPWVPCAIYIDWRGNLVAERDGKFVSPRAIWPYAATNPITYEEYAQMHKGEPPNE